MGQRRCCEPNFLTGGLGGVGQLDFAIPAAAHRVCMSAQISISEAIVPRASAAPLVCGVVR